MKVLYIDLDQIIKNDILWGLIELGIDVYRLNLLAPVEGISYDVVSKIEKELVEYNIVITQNFSASVAEACHRKCIPYIAWVYDSPQVETYSNEAKYDESYIFMFDKKGAQRLVETGISKVYHRPLAANLALASGVNITDEDLRKYEADVSFVGKIYSNDFYEELYNAIPSVMKEHFNSIIDNNIERWDGNSIYNHLSKQEVDALYNIMDKSGLDRINMPIQLLIETLIFPKEIAGKERIKLINEAAKICNMAMYTYDPQNYSGIIKARLFGPVDMESDMYKVFYASKINLNTTLRSIETGIPQRIFDIMSVGGFVLSNWQEEIEELFDVDKEIVVFHSVDEYVDKIKYYLTHERERIQIGINGYKKVKEKYTYPIVLKQMINFVCKDWGYNESIIS